MQCFVCKQNVDKHHKVLLCAKKHQLGMASSEVRFRQLWFTLGFEPTKKFMVDQYVACSKSLPDFKKEFGLAYTQTVFLLKYHGIPVRSISEASSSSKCQDQRRQTSIAIYGVDNPSKSAMVKAEKARTFASHYGVDNIWKAPGYRQRSHRTMVQRYGKGSVSNLYGKANPFGVHNLSQEQLRKRLAKAHAGFKMYWESMTDNERTELIQKRCSHLVKSFKSSLESKVQEALTSMRLPFVWQKWIRRKSYDFHILGTNCVIEVQGDFWHANPRLYKADDPMRKDKRILASEIWKRDEQKKTNAERFGYTVLYLWEDELRKLTKTQLIDLLWDCLENGGRHP